MADEKKKVVALLSGGLDSQLAVRMMQEQGFDVSAVAIKTPFCDFDCGRGCGFEIRERADDLNVNLKTVYLGDEYIEMLKHPKYGTYFRRSSWTKTDESTCSCITDY
jgi:tRNA U34 2-thiouridine synthase MnmA/TrmU